MIEGRVHIGSDPTRRASAPLIWRFKDDELIYCIYILPGWRAGLLQPFCRFGAGLIVISIQSGGLRRCTSTPTHIEAPLKRLTVTEKPERGP